MSLVTAGHSTGVVGDSLEDLFLATSSVSSLCRTARQPHFLLPADLTAFNVPENGGGRALSVSDSSRTKP